MLKIEDQGHRLRMDEWETKYEFVPSCVEKEKKAPQKLMILPQDNLEGAHPTSAGWQTKDWNPSLYDETPQIVDWTQIISVW